MFSGEKDFEVVATTNCGQHLVQLSETHLPDIILAEMQLPGLSALEAATLIHLKNTQIKMVCFTNIADSFLIAAAIKGGISAFVSKKCSKQLFMEAIEAVSDGKIYYGYGQPHSFYTHCRRERNSVLFSEKELQIIRMICQEYQSREIAAKICLGNRTVEVYRNTIMKKMKVRNIAGVVIYAIKNHIYKLPLIMPWITGCIEIEMLP